MDIVTLMPKFPLSANNCAIDVSKTKQSEFMIAELTPSCIDLGVASQVRRRRCPLSSNLRNTKLEPSPHRQLIKQPVRKILRLFPGAYQLYNGKELLMSIKFFLFF